MVRALDCGSRGPPFDPGRRYQQNRKNIETKAGTRERVPFHCVDAVPGGARRRTGRSGAARRQARSSAGRPPYAPAQREFVRGPLAQHDLDRGLRDRRHRLVDARHADIAVGGVEQLDPDRLHAVRDAVQEIPMSCRAA